jgi:predicted transcriptional regulator
MASTTIRIRSTSHRSLKEIAESSGQSLQDALDQAIEERRRTLYLEGVNADYAALNPKALADFKKEIGAWDVTDADGLPIR